MEGRAKYANGVKQVMVNESKDIKKEQGEFRIVNALAVHHRRLNQLVVECSGAALRIRPIGIVMKLN